VAALPAKTLPGDTGSLGFRPDQSGISGTVTFAKGMPADGQGHRLLIVHRHTGKGLPDIPS